MHFGIIAGSGFLPISIANIINKIDTPHIVGIEGYANPEDFTSYKYLQCKIGHVGKAINFLKENNVTKIVFAGKVNRPKFSNLSVDKAGASLLAQIVKNTFLGDDKVFTIVEAFFESKGLQVLAITELIKDQMKSGILTKIKPSNTDIDNINIGMKVARAIGALDIGQAVIVESKVVLGVEATEGTDQLIRRCAELKFEENNGVLVKALKPQQTIKMDVPAIGTQTVREVVAAGFTGIAIEKGIVIDIDNVVKLADELGIFISVY